MMRQIDSQWLHWPETKALAEAIRPLRFAGGCVRDALLERAVSDIDAATPLLPEQVMALLRSAGMKAVPTGIDHGTVTAVLGARHFEITTLRRDVATDGRHATVAFTDDWKEDAARRDFTMNALFCDEDGRVHDYFGGADDALAGHVRFIGSPEARIREDGLRILRFFRFFAHYGKGAVDAEGLKACGELAPMIEALSGERIRQEMFKLLISEKAAEVVGLLQRHGVWPYLADCIVKGETLARLPLLLAKAARAADPLLSLALLLRSARRDGVAAGVAARWKLSRAQQKTLELLCDTVHAPVADEKEAKKHIRAWGRELFIGRALIAAAEGAEEASTLAAIALALEWEAPSFPVSGNDLIALGLRPGKAIGETLKMLEAAWEEGDYKAGKESLLSRLKA